MKLKQLELRKLEIPFLFSFKHASADRSVTEAVIAIAESDSLVKGFGEGCPRQYVTGENIDSCLSFLNRYREDILEIQDVQTLKEWISKNSSVIDANPAAWRTIETAILDLLGKTQEQSIERLLGTPEVDREFSFSAILGISSPKIFDAQCAQYYRLGFTDFKVKVSGDFDSDIQSIQTLTKRFPSSRIRIDANNLWDDADIATNYLASLGFNFWAIEEPLKASDFKSLRKIARSLGCKIILDESFLGAKTFEHIQVDHEVWIPNIRISKMGGLLRSLTIAEQCKQLGLNFILGAQVGETSILTRVALTLANAFGQNLIAQEGAFGTYLLTRDVIDAPIMFGAGGVLRANFVGLPGLGLNIVLP